MAKKLIKLSDYIARYIRDLGVTDVFMVTGGGAMHLNDSFGNCPGLRYTCCHHEQACAMAAEVYSRLNGFACVNVTTGPGGTNTLTGLIGAWLDSIPVLFISGNVRTPFIGAGRNGLRQIGIQELNITDIVPPITKYTKLVITPGNIAFELEKATYEAKNGRPGPVWLDIPLDVQSAMIDESSLRHFSPPKEPRQDRTKILHQINEVTGLLQSAKRPVLMVGGGVRISGASAELLTLIDQLKIPVVTGMSAHDLIPSDHPLYFGRPGPFGERVGNFVVQNSDLVISIGSRLHLWDIGMTIAGFARGARKIVVDIDPAELAKPTIHPDIAIACDAKYFIQTLYELYNQSVPWGPAAGFPPRPPTKGTPAGGGPPTRVTHSQSRIFVERTDCATDWLSYCRGLKKKYPVVLPQYKKQKKFVNSYYFIDVLSHALKPGDIIVTANGTAFTGTRQAFFVKKNQRLISNIGCASMGYDLPAAVGAAVATKGKKRIICISGDGSIQMNIQELQTIVHNKFPIKIFILNNEGYLAIRNTQDTFFKSRYVGADQKNGVSCPDMVKIGTAYGIPSIRMNNQKDMITCIRKTLYTKGPAICDVMMDPKQPLIPKVTSLVKPDGKMVSKPIEDMYPFLPREEFAENMIIPPLSED